MQNNKTYIIKLGLILFLITFIATILLTFCNYITKDKIASISQEKSQKAMQELLKDCEFSEIDFTKYSDDTKNELTLLNCDAIFKATKDGKDNGYCVNVSPMGFGDKIVMMVGLDTDLNYTGIKIVSLAETPGLGAKAQEKDFTDRFTNKKGELKVVKTPTSKEDEIQALSGATITSKAVTTGVNNAKKCIELITKEDK